MSALKGKTVVVGVCGGIAAYKSAFLVRLLIKAGAAVQVAMTQAAQQFVGPATFQALTGHPVFTNLFDLTQESEIGHIKLADSADLVVIAPATATTLARLAQGLASDPVSCVCLATKAPVLLAPSMNVNMWNHPETQANLNKCGARAGWSIVSPESGFLACKWEGKGRLASPESIAKAAEAVLTTKTWRGRQLLIAAGPTREPIDGVRYVSNPSTGRMGIALAEQAAFRGAIVTLVLGPSGLEAPENVTVVSVMTASEMRQAVMERWQEADAVIMAAAVSDFRPAQQSQQKLKKSELGDSPQLALVANPDILAELGAARQGDKPLLVGFAAETQDVVANAQVKIKRKNCDVIVANDVSRSDAGFTSETNEVVMIRRAGEILKLPLASKYEIAGQILDELQLPVA